MLRVLASLTAGLLLSAVAFAPSSAAAVSYNVTFILYHPRGSTTMNNLLTCGWHSNCANGPNGGQALDWIPADSGYTTTWKRLVGVGGPGPSTWVARMQSYYTTSPCKQIKADIFRISDWAPYGYVHQYHSGGNPNPNYSNLYASTAGAANAGVAGYILPHDQDNCYSEGDHTHQFYASGPYDLWYGKNSTQTFNTCDLCYAPYAPWSTWEYGIQFATG